MLRILNPSGRNHAFIIDLNGGTHHTFDMMDRHIFRSECGRRFRASAERSSAGHPTARATATVHIKYKGWVVIVGLLTSSSPF